MIRRFATVFGVVAGGVTLSVVTEAFPVVTGGLLAGAVVWVGYRYVRYGIDLQP